MQVFLILFSIYFAHNQPLILNPYIELTLSYCVTNVVVVFPPLPTD